MTTPLSASPSTLPTNIPLASDRNENILKWAGLAAALLVALLIGLLTISYIGLGLGLLPLLTGIVLATLPVPIYIALAVWVDRYEPEPLWMLTLTFLWGATVSVFISLIVNELSSLIVGGTLGRTASSFFTGSVSAPFIEEFSKALALLILFLWKRDEFNGVIDGIVYAAMVGLGFAMTENILYYGNGIRRGNILFTFILRGVMRPFSHPLYTSMTGIGLGIASQSKNLLVKIIAPLLGFGVAIMLHSTWNTSAFLGRGLAVIFGVHFLIMVPVFLGLLIFIAFALRREGSIIREYLQPELQSGLLTAEEHGRLGSVPRRIRASLSALQGGFGSYRTRRRFNNIASELAFHRHRVARGLATANASTAARESIYTQHLRDLSGQLGKN